MEQEEDARGEAATPGTPTTQQAERGDSARPTPMTSAAPRAGNTHEAHSPQGPPTRYTARTRNQRPGRTRANTPALQTQPGPKGGSQQGRERHDNNSNRYQTNPVTTYRLQRPRHRLNCKQHETPAYHEPGPQGA